MLTYAAGIIGNFFTSTGINGEWYASAKPEINLPSISFPIVWNVLFLLIAVSWWLAVNKADKRQRRKIWISYGLNLVFNVLWSVFYFGMQNAGLAFADSIVILLSIIFMMASVFKVEERSVWLLVPYLLWVCFACILTYMSLLKVL